jgi:hypothetical protein
LAKIFPFRFACAAIAELVAIPMFCPMIGAQP